MITTAEQFKKQHAFWKDKWYSYAIHKTDGGAMYLYRINGRKIDKNTIKNMQVFRLDGVNMGLLVENFNKVKGE